MLDRQGKKTERMAAVREARQASVRPRHQSLIARSRFLTRSRLRAVSRPRRSISRVELTSALSKIGIGDIGAAKVRAAELAAVQLGASETRVAQRGELEHGARKVGVLEARAVEPRRASRRASAPSTGSRMSAERSARSRRARVMLALVRSPVMRASERSAPSSLAPMRMWRLGSPRPAAAGLRGTVRTRVFHRSAPTWHLVLPQYVQRQPIAFNILEAKRCCGPSFRSLRHTHELLKKFRLRGLTFADLVAARGQGNAVPTRTPLR